MDSALDGLSVQMLSSLVFGVAVPLTSLAVLSVGCGGNARHSKRKISNRHKKKSIGSRKKSSSSRKKKDEMRKHSAKAPVKPPIANQTLKPPKRTSVSQMMNMKGDSSSNKKLGSKKGSASNTSASMDSILQKQSYPTPPRQKNVQPTTPKTKDQEKSWANVSNKRDLTVKGFPKYCSEKPDVWTKPDQLKFDIIGGSEELIVQSKSSASRYALKIKCSDNELYRVNPVYAFLEPGGKNHIRVYRNGGAAKFDKLVVVLSEVSKAEKDPSAVFASNNTAVSMLVIPLFPLLDKCSFDPKTRACSACVLAN